MGIPAYFKFDFFQPIIVSAAVFASVSILCYCFRDTPAVCFRGVHIISSNSLVTCLRFSPLTSGENFIPLPNHFPSALIKRLYVIHAASQCVLRVTGTLNRQAVECHSSAAQLCCDYLIVFFPVGPTLGGTVELLSASPAGRPVLEVKDAAGVEVQRRENANLRRDESPTLYLEP